MTFLERTKSIAVAWLVGAASAAAIGVSRKRGVCQAQPARHVPIHFEPSSRNGEEKLVSSAVPGYCQMSVRVAGLTARDDEKPRGRKNR
jgi:hypothetical protein